MFTYIMLSTRQKRKTKKGKGFVSWIQNLGARLTSDSSDPKNQLFSGENHPLGYNNKKKTL